MPWGSMGENACFPLTLLENRIIVRKYNSEVQPKAEH